MSLARHGNGTVAVEPTSLLQSHQAPRSSQSLLDQLKTCQSRAIFRLVILIALLSVIS